MELGLALRRKRRLLKQDQAIAAAEIGTTQPTYSRWENGERSPGVENLKAIAKYLSLDEAEVAALIFSVKAEADSDRIRNLRDEVAALRAIVERLDSSKGAGQ